jgi:hypothetical protein
LVNKVLLIPLHGEIFNKFDRKVKFRIDGAEIFDDIFLKPIGDPVWLTPPA